MLIKKAYKGEFKHLLSILRLATLDNRSYVVFSKKKFNYLAILALLQNEGFIESYDDRGQFIIISLKQTYWKSYQFPMHAFSTLENVRINKSSTATNKQVNRQNKRQGQVAYMVLSTDQGILSSRESSRKKIGGMPLFKIY